MRRNMTDLLYRADSWVTAVVLLALMISAWSVGRWWGRHMAARGAGVDSKIPEASLALMGLLLGFTFAIALDKHGKRREMVVTDANAIGDFYTTVSLLKEPVRTPLQQVVREYAQFRLDFVRHPLTEESQLDDAIAKINVMHTRMTDLVRQAVEANTPVVEPLVDTLNGLTSSHAARLAAGRDRLPWPIVMLLSIALLMSLGLVGRGQGLEGKSHALSTVGFMIMTAFALYLTIDLNQPQRGLMRVSQEPLERLVAAMK
jgi:hypothetical protein